MKTLGSIEMDGGWVAVDDHGGRGGGQGGGGGIIIIIILSAGVGGSKDENLVPTYQKSIPL